MNKSDLYYGKYRGTVVNNADPLQKGRLQLQVPDVDGLSPSTWALPCFPFTGKQMGVVALPELGAGVWVEFEQGDTDYPIWTGCWYGSSAELPPLALSTPPPLSSFVVQTAAKHVFMLSDNPGPSGGILLKSSDGSTISMSEQGIYISKEGAQISIGADGITLSNGKGAKIQLTGNTVDINEGVFTVS